MAEGLGAKLKSIFTEFDSNKEHVIPREKLVDILKALDPTWTQDELDTLFEIADKDGNGVIDYDEFIDFICYMDYDDIVKDKKEQEAAKMIFECSDGSGDLMEICLAEDDNEMMTGTFTFSNTSGTCKYTNPDGEELTFSTATGSFTVVGQDSDNRCAKFLQIDWKPMGKKKAQHKVKIVWEDRTDGKAGTYGPRVEVEDEEEE